MSSERDKPHEPDPFDGVITSTYDCCGRLTSTQDGIGRGANERWAFSYCDPNASRPEPAQSMAAAPCLRRCFAFRLCGSEAQEQTLAVETFDGVPLVVAIERVRAYLTGAGPGAAAASAIGGIEVHAALVASRVVCTAQLSDFQAGDLVVVEVEVAVYRCGGNR